MTFRKAISPIRTVMFSLVAVCLFTACQDDEFETIATDAEAEMVTTGETESNIGSITVTGENTEVVSTVDCTTCTFVVESDREIIDGAELKPGSVICLQTGVKYGNIEFVNLKGTAENPIVIGSCSN